MSFKAAWKAFNKPELVELSESITNMLTLYDWVEVRMDRFGEYDLTGKTTEREHSGN